MQRLQGIRRKAGAAAPRLQVGYFQHGVLLRHQTAHRQPVLH